MLEQFMKLPPAQKAGVLAAILVVIGAGGYFLVIDPEVSRATKAEGDVRRVTGELKGLDLKASGEELKRLRKLKDELVEANKEDRKMLPASEEVPDFIEQVNRDARASGLSVKRFERLETHQRNMVNAIPVKMVVRGSMIDLIKFLRIYASPSRRVIHLKQLQIETIAPDLSVLGKELKDSKPIEEQKITPNTPDEWLLQNIGIQELARKRSSVKATFIAYAFTWTGKEAANPTPSEEDGKKKKRT
ncbi:MAG: type 4a pilus biogenesis protein PilO [Myxococcales bacterium]|nr:type 4a pilus biogenesis protein PilO [Myxococcales bacterium]